MLFADAITRWLQSHDSSLSQDTHADVVAIRESVVAGPFANRPVEHLDDEALAVIASSVGSESRLSDEAIGQFLEIVHEWSLNQLADDAPPLEPKPADEPSATPAATDSMPTVDPLFDDEPVPPSNAVDSVTEPLDDPTDLLFDGPLTSTSKDAFTADPEPSDAVDDPIPTPEPTRVDPAPTATAPPPPPPLDDPQPPEPEPIDAVDDPIPTPEPIDAVDESTDDHESDIVVIERAPSDTTALFANGDPLVGDAVPSDAANLFVGLSDEALLGDESAPHDDPAASSFLATLDSTVIESVDEAAPPDTTDEFERVTDEPDEVVDEETGDDDADTPEGVFSEAASQTNRRSIDWITVAYFTVAAVCFGVVIYLWWSSR